jgi:hypothetical protein
MTVALSRDGEIDEHDAILFNDADQQDDSDDARHREVHAAKAQGQERTDTGCGQLLMYRYFRNSILIDLLPKLFPPGFRERERPQA